MTAAARLIAKLLAHRPTSQDEVGDIIRNVHGALAQLDDKAASPLPAAASEVRPERKRRRAPPPRLETPVDEPTAPLAVPSPAPKLVRRAMAAAAPASHPAFAPEPSATSTVRGIVKWFDPKNGKGALRLPGIGDIPLDPRIVADSGITRLFKGQEIEATLTGGKETPELLRLTVPGAAAASPLGHGGVVHSRRAKPVVVEMKREGLRRVAARAEAEQLLGRTR
jgi:hypothetical protein